MSTRRVPKGPGRRPKSLARQQFMDLLANGWSLLAACREVGVSRSAAQIWKNGTTVCRPNGTVRVVPPLEPSAVRPISPRFLSEEERIRIADMASRGDGPTVIGRALSRSPSKISRELRRNLHPSGQYRPFHAQRLAAVRRRRPKALRLTLNPELHAFVSNRLRLRWSPQQISRALRAAHPGEPGMRLSTESIYLAIYRPDNGLHPKPDPSPLRTGRDHRKAHARQVRSRRRSPNPCSASTTVASNPPTGQWPATGKET